MRIGKPPADLRRNGPLMRGMAVRVQQADGDGLAVQRGKCVESQGLELAVWSETSADAEAPVERHEWLGLRGAQPIEMRARLTAEMQEVLEAGVGHEGGACALSLEQRVGRHRRPVGEPLHLDRADGARCGDDRLLLLWRRQHLGGRQASVVEQHRVRERPANVDAEDGHSGRLTA